MPAERSSIMPDDRKLVYSSEAGWKETPEPRSKKPRSNQPIAKNALPDDGVVRIARERRRGSVVTLVHGLNPNETAAIAKALKKLCGTGGTVKNAIVEIQGDHRETVLTWLISQGKKAKLAGG